jgi:regulator of sigma D
LAQPLAVVVQHLEFVPGTIVENKKLARQRVIVFNNKYGGTDTQQMSEELERDLAALGKHLATRIDLEDQLITELRPR